MILVCILVYFITCQLDRITSKHVHDIIFADPLPQ